MGDATLRYMDDSIDNDTTSRPAITGSDYVLTPKQSEFVRLMANGASGREAARAIGYKGSGQGSKLLADENLRNALKLAAIEMGNTPEAIGITLREAREANRVELDREGNPVDLGPDHPSRIKATDVLVRLMGGYPNPRADLDLNAQNVLVIRADQALAASDPFSAVASETEGVEVLPMPVPGPESHPTRLDFDSVV